MNEIAAAFSKIAVENKLRLETCAEEVNLGKFEIKHARCIDDRLIEQIIGCPLKVKKDLNQRNICGCAASIDVGAFNTCIHDCVYCYANFNKTMAKNNHTAYDVNSPLLCSSEGDEDKVISRKEKDIKSLKETQLSLL
jgi:hypothetical protein